MDIRSENVAIACYSGNERTMKDNIVAEEAPLTIFLNDEEIATLLCTPENLKYLAVGFLYSEGILQSKEEIKKITADDQKGIVWVETVENKDFVKNLINKRLITSGCGKGATFYNVADSSISKEIKSNFELSFKDALDLAKDLQNRSELYKITGGVHSATLCNNKDVLVFSDDIGRHNAIDKIFGRCLLEEISTIDKIIVTTGRVSSEILLKIVKMNIPILISRSAPTALAVRLANRLGITLIGYARGKRMNVYSHENRIIY
ncbi:MAG: formate dehydrogenase accessory sulfurtransferase FdhD [Spirochaetota bacterium]|nr:formate dehydrogenase accessory sulfurtransferase FdhD [Spirochaetota bacterium]